WRVAGGRLQVGDLMAFIQYVMFIMFSLLMVSMMLVILPRAAVSASRIHQVRTTAPSIEDEAGARPVPVRRGVVEFRRATVQYPDRKSTRLNSSHVKISYAVFCLKKK